FFQAEDGIRDFHVTGVQTCALPILRAARLDHTVEAEIRRLAAVDVLIIDDFALRPLDATETSDFYEIVVERHRTKTTIVTSNRVIGRASCRERGYNTAGGVLERDTQ